jgi:hypothetical protein
MISKRTLLITATIAVTIASAYAASCSSSSTPAPPPAGVSNVYYATFDSTPSPQIGVVAFPLTNSSSPSVTVASSVANSLNGASQLQFDSFGRLWTISDNPTPPTVQIFTLPLTAGSIPTVNLTLTGALNVFNFVFDKSGNLWVTDRGVPAVYEYTGPFNASGSISPALTLTSNLSSPVGLAFDPAGNLYVANSTSAGVNSITFFTAPISNLMASSGFLQGVTNPRAMVSDVSGNLYVGTQASSVVRYNAGNLINGATPNITNTTGILAGTFVYQMQFDPSGNLYVATCAGTAGNQRLYEFPTGTQAFSSTLAPTVSYTDANIQNQNCVSGVAFK